MPRRWRGGGARHGAAAEHAAEEAAAELAAAEQAAAFAAVGASDADMETTGAILEEASASVEAAGLEGENAQFLLTQGA